MGTLEAVIDRTYRQCAFQSMVQFDKSTISFVRMDGGPLRGLSIWRNRSETQVLPLSYEWHNHTLQNASESVEGK